MSVRIGPAAAGDIDGVRALLREYEAEIGVDLCFQSFERELAELPGKYAPPAGVLLVARAGGEFAGCVGLRQLDGDVCEMKRLYVRPAYRRAGAGRALVTEVVAAAKRIGYRRMRLDTLDTMHAAQALYRALGFRPTEPYGHHPIAGTVFLEFALA